MNKKPSYYQGSRLTEALAQTSHGRFICPGDQMWPLIYSDAQGNPAVIVLAVEHQEKMTGFCKLMAALGKVSRMSQIPLLVMAFKEDSKGMRLAVVDGPGEKPRTITPNNWGNLLKTYGVPIKTGTSVKPVNTQISSSYHQWQRNFVGSACVCDLDLIQADSQGNPVGVIELKRSKISLDQWAPFSKDYPNFNLTLALCQKAGMKFKIAYNYFTTGDMGQDDTSKIKLFRYDQANQPTFEGVVTGTDFLAGQPHLGLTEIKPKAAISRPRAR